MADPALERICHSFTWLNRASLGGVIRAFRRAGVRRFTMAGKFHKHIIYQPWRWLQLVPDWRMLRFYLLRKRAANNDDSITAGSDRRVPRRRHGVRVGPGPVPGVAREAKASSPAASRPSPSERDIEFGWHLAREMGRLDVGQSVMVRERAVLAVEAIEGTDRAIRRAGELCSPVAGSWW